MYTFYGCFKYTCTLCQHWDETAATDNHFVAGFELVVESDLLETTTESVHFGSVAKEIYKPDF